MPEYSVQIVTPVYNSSKTLKKCLDSLLNQTFKAWQVILVDDASKDNSLEVIKEYALKDKRIKFIALEKNGGSSNARNQALKIIDAEYVAFLDSDDLWLPGKLSRQTEFMESNHCKPKLRNFTIISKYLYLTLTIKSIIKKEKRL